MDSRILDTELDQKIEHLYSLFEHGYIALKLKPTSNGWLAQVRPYIKEIGNKREFVGHGDTRSEAVDNLHKKLQDGGIS